MNQSDDTWHKTTQGISPSSSTRLRRAVTQFEIEHRLHWSEVRLSQVKADMDPATLRTHVLGSSKDLHFLAVHLADIFSGFFGAKRLLFNVSFLFSPGKETDLIAMETYGQWVGEITHHIKLEKIRCTIGMGSLGNCYNTWQYTLMTMWVWYLGKAVGQVGGFCLCCHVPTVCFNWKLLNQIKRPRSKNKTDNVNIPQYLHLIPKIRSCENTNSSRIKKITKLIDYRTLTFLWAFTRTNPPNWQRGRALGLPGGTFHPAGRTLMALRRATGEAAVKGAPGPQSPGMYLEVGHYREGINQKRATAPKQTNGTMFWDIN